MSDYKRNYLSGGTYFFTVNLKFRNKTYLYDYFSLLRQSIRHVKLSKPFKIIAWVVLPDHLHMIWTLPVGDSDFSNRWRAIKTLFCSSLGRFESFSCRKNIWQPRFWEHTIQSQEDLQNHINYIHINPLKHGHVLKVIHWPFSSFHHYVKRGVYSETWGVGVEIPDSSGFGE